MKTHTQLHNNFRRFDQATRRDERIALRIELDAPACAKAAMTIAQIQLGVQVSPHVRRSNSVFVATPCVQHLDPLQDLAQIAVVRPRVTDDATSQCSRYARPKL